MGNSTSTRTEETRRIGLRIFAMTACAAAFAAGVFFPSPEGDKLAQSTAEPTRVAISQVAFNE